MHITVSKNSTIFFKRCLQHLYKDLVPFRCISLIHLFIVFTHKSPGIQSINIHSKLYCFHYNLLCCRKIGHKNLISIYSFVIHVRKWALFVMRSKRLSYYNFYVKSFKAFQTLYFTNLMNSKVKHQIERTCS